MQVSQAGANLLTQPLQQQSQSQPAQQPTLQVYTQVVGANGEMQQIPVCSSYICVFSGSQHAGSVTYIVESHIHSII